MNVDVKNKSAIERFFVTAEKRIAETENKFLSEIKEKAKKKLSEGSFPTLKTEEWKYTNLKELLKTEFVHSAELPEVNVAESDVEKLKFNSFENNLIVIVNGVLIKQLSDVEELNKEIVVSTITEAVTSNHELVEKYLTKISVGNTAFDYINISNFSDGLFIQIPNGKIVKKPIQILNISNSKGKEAFSTSRNLIIVGKNSQASIVQKFVGDTDEKYFSNIASEIFIDENGTLDIYKVELENNKTFHFDKVDVLQSRDSKFNHYNFSFGGKLVRNDVNTKLDAQNVECTLNGLYIGNGNQHIDNNTFVDHAKPYSLSNQLYKGILDDTSHGIFSGKILVARDAQLTNAYQNNNTILLSDEAKVDSKPQLEIYADDVKCTHGATVGHLDESALFYILSRGIPKEKAKSMLITAFAESVVTGVKIEAMRDEINHLIFEHLNRVEI